MHPVPRRLLPLAVALDQAFFFLVVFVLTYFAILICAWGACPLGAYALMFVACLPLVVVSAVFAAQLSRWAPPPVARRNRFVLREIRPQEPPRHLPRRAA